MPRLEVGLKVFAVQGGRGDDWAMYVAPSDTSDEEVMAHGMKLPQAVAESLVLETQDGVEPALRPFFHMEYRR